MDVRSPHHWANRCAPLSRATALALLCALIAPGLAHAQGSTTGSFGISPARRNVVAQPPHALVPTHVANTTNVPYAVTVFPVLLTQDLTGAFNFSQDPRDLRAASTILSTSLKPFSLAPGAAQDVALRWNLLPLNSRAAYVGIVFQGQPHVAGHAVSVISRLLSINFLRVPGVYRSNGIFTGMPVTQFAPQVLRVLPRVKNTGDVVDAPQHGRLLIRDSAGHAVYKTHWTGDVILPGAVREFPIDIKQLLPAGTYTAVAAMTFGANRNARISTTFTLVGPNELPTPNVNITDFAARGAIGDPAHITATVHSTGTAPVSLDLKLALYRLQGGIPGAALATKAVHFGPLAPKSSRGLDEQLGKLQAGQYRVIGTYVDPTGAPQQLTSDFTSTKRLSFWDHLKNFFTDHGVLLISLLVLLLLAALLARMLRRQRRLEAALRAASGAPTGTPPPPPLRPQRVAPVPPAPASPPPAPTPPPPAVAPAPPPAPPPAVVPVAAVVNVNSASAEDLERVPGIGPKAARRIVEHREEFGDFASLDGLARVKGFDSERIAELREHLRV